MEEAPEEGQEGFMITTPQPSLQSLGGKARAQKLSKERLREIARHGAEVRWANTPRVKKGRPEYFSVRLSWEEFLWLPLRTRRRILREHEKEFIEAERLQEFQDALDFEEDP